jgi:hypothetical protein
MVSLWNARDLPTCYYVTAMPRPLDPKEVRDPEAEKNEAAALVMEAEMPLQVCRVAFAACGMGHSRTCIHA